MEEAVSVDASFGRLPAFRKPVVATSYAIAGRFICVRSADEELADLFRHYFSSWHVKSISEQSSVQPHATILVTAATPPAPPEHLPPFEVADGGTCRADATTYFFQDKGSVVRSRNSDSPQVEVWVGNSQIARERPRLARLVFNAAMNALRRAGLYELHAAGVVSPAGDGYLVVGPSGSGKSALATKLASAGWQYLSDDTLLLGESCDRIEAHALRRVFALTDDTFTTATGLDLSLLDTHVEAFDPFKKRFDPRKIFPHQFTDACIPKVLLFSRVSHEPQSRTQLLPRSDTMARLLRMCPWACYDKSVAGQHLSVLGQLARQAKGFELDAGEDLLHDADYANRFLLELLG